MSRSKHASASTSSKSAIERQREFFEHDLLELRVLWPRLLAAVGRDAAAPATSGGSGASGGVKGSPAPVNVDVVQAIAEIESGCGQTLAEVRRLLGDRAPSAWQPRTWLTRPEGVGPVCRSRCRHTSCLRITGLWIRRELTVWMVLDRLPMWHAGLVREHQPLAVYLCDDVRAWRRSARTALRLSRRGPLLDWLCPDHRDTAPTRLRVDREEAELHPAILNNRPMPAKSEPITWVAPESAQCEKCRRKWKGAEQLAGLKKLVDALDLVTLYRSEPHTVDGLIDFITARLADEQTRVAADVAAIDVAIGKYRRIVEAATALRSEADGVLDEITSGIVNAGEVAVAGMLAAIATRWSSHPDYRTARAAAKMDL